MDPLSALGIAAAVVQFVDFGGKILNRTWDKYKRYKGADATRQIKQETEELTEMAQESSNLAKAVQASTNEFAQVSTAESQLIRLCAECESINIKFQDVLSKIGNRERRPEDDSDEKAKKKIIRLPLAGIWNAQKIKQMHERLEALRNKIMSSIIFCLWVDSKKTQQWELYFTQQLDGIFDILRRVEASTLNLKQQSTLLRNSKAHEASAAELNGVCQGIGRVTSAAGQDASKPRVELTETFLHLFKARQSISLASIGEEVVKILNDTASPDMAHLRVELVQLLWDKRWALDSSMVTISDTEYQEKTGDQDIGKRLCDGLYFESMYNREGAVADNFEATYEWIFRREPKKQNGKALWQSLPEWLESDSNTPYWITGKPGSGKSTIMKLVSRHPGLRAHLLPWAGSLQVVVANYYAWNSGVNMQKAWEGLKRTVLHQAFSQNRSCIPKIAPRRWALFQALRNTKFFPPWETWEVDESFDFLLNECGKSMAVALFVDGLDEFEMPPASVVSHIRSMTNKVAHGIKICVASRPWTEFDDAFNNGPMLQMHLLTEDDMTAFVAESFQGNRGHIELSHVYPQQVMQLTRDIVQKSDGVFLWVSLVVAEITDLLTAGDSIAQLQETLKALPSDLSLLYDAIWGRIPPRHFSDACAMIRLTIAAYGPSPWFLMWLADESRSMKVDPSAMAPEAKFHAKRGLKRRLATRTRGILELNSAVDGLVNFAHRTARDWVEQPHVWDRVCSSCPAEFEPNLLLLKAEALLMTDDETTSEYAPNSLWLAVMRALWYASQISGGQGGNNFEGLITVLDDFDEATLGAYRRVQRTWPTIYQLTGPEAHWSSGQDVFGHRQGLPNSFLGLTAQFSILPYVRTKVRARRSPVHQWAAKNTIGLLENAVFGYKYYMAENFKPPNGLPDIEVALRLATVRLLLDHGVQQSKAHSAHDVVSIRDEVKRIAAKHDKDEVYFLQVSEYLDKMGLLQSTFRRFRSALQNSD